MYKRQVCTLLGRLPLSTALNAGVDDTFLKPTLKRVVLQVGMEDGDSMDCMKEQVGGALVCHLFHSCCSTSAHNRQ